MDHTTAHIPVLLNEATDALVHTTSGCYVDGTFGRGGHSRAILQHLGEDARLIAFDKDPEAVVCANAIKDRRFSIRHESFTGIKELPKSSVDGVLLDLGVSSPQIDTPQRGFSFRHDGPLDMRMDTTRGISVAQWLETAKTEHIAEVIHDYGEERFATQVAKAIVAFRQEQGSITSTAQLASIVAGAVKTREPGQDPATRTFQAFRIYINAELEELRQALDSALAALKPNGRLVVITFHSLEDRIVKQFMVRHARELFDRRQPANFAQEPLPMPLRDVSRHRPSADEVKRNPRARSAILRVAVRSEAQV